MYIWYHTIHIIMKLTSFLEWETFHFTTCSSHSVQLLNSMYYLDVSNLCDYKQFCNEKLVCMSEVFFRIDQEK